MRMTFAPARTSAVALVAAVFDRRGALPGLYPFGGRHLGGLPVVDPHVAVAGMGVCVSVENLDCPREIGDGLFGTAGVGDGGADVGEGAADDVAQVPFLGRRGVRRLAGIPQPVQPHFGGAAEEGHGHPGALPAPGRGLPVPQDVPQVVGGVGTMGGRHPQEVEGAHAFSAGRGHGAIEHPHRRLPVEACRALVRAVCEEERGRIRISHVRRAPELWVA